MAHNHGATGHAARKKARGVRYTAYRASGRREVNKAVKLVRHLARHMFDECADDAFDRIGAHARDAAVRLVAARKRACGMA